MVNLYAGIVKGGLIFMVSVSCKADCKHKNEVLHCDKCGKPKNIRLVREGNSKYYRVDRCDKYEREG